MGTFGKKLENMQIERIPPKVESSPVLNVYDLPILVEYMHMLEDGDKDLMFLIFMGDKKQEDIGAMFGVTQEAVSYQIAQLKKRVRFIRRMKSAQKHVDKFLDFIQSKYNVSGALLEVAVLMFFTTSQTASAEILGINQAVVRYRFLLFLQQLERMELPTKFDVVKKFFLRMKKNHNMTRRIRRG